MDGGVLLPRGGAQGYGRAQIVRLVDAESQILVAYPKFAMTSE